MHPVVLATHEWPATGADAGAAAPVAVAVHGITGWWRTWWRVAPALAERGWRVVSNTGVRPAELAPILAVPALYLVADARRSALGALRTRLLGFLPPGAEAVEFDCGHTIHRDRFDDYLAAVVGWLGR